MHSSINLNHIKHNFIAAYHTVANKASEWAGRVVTIVKSGRQETLRHLQDPRIAAIALIGVNIALLHLGRFFAGVIRRSLPNTTDFQKSVRRKTFPTITIGTIIGGVALFSKYANLPLSKLAITAISVSTVITYVLLK